MGSASYHGLRGMGSDRGPGVCSDHVAQSVSDNAIFDAVWSIVTRRIAERTSATVDLLGDVVHGLGQIHRREHELLAGERVLNNDRQILPRVARATGLGLCLYLGNRRIASASVLDAGEAPEADGYADAVVVDAVLRKRETFRGEVDRGGRLHIIACRPLFATDKPDDYGPVGMMEAFIDQEGFRELVANTLRESLGADVRSSEEEQVDRMQTVMQFIDDVARRLQLLALNGNIIAAQAGDHGRAFRVVCRELSSLAEQSKDAVSEVRKLSTEMAGGVPATADTEGSDSGGADAGPSGEAESHDPELDELPPPA